MTFSTGAVLALISVIYRVTLNLPDMPYSAGLKSRGGSDFADASQQVVDAVDFLLKPVPGFHNVTVRDFRHQQVVGTMVTLDVMSTNAKDAETVRKLFSDAVQEGHMGWLSVAPEGFEFFPIPVNTTSPGKQEIAFGKPTTTCADGSLPEYSLHGSTYCWSHSVCPSGTACVQSQCCRTAPGSVIRKCSESKWECGDGRCLRMNMRCDGLIDCLDKSDELYCNGNEKRSVEHGCPPGEFQCDSGECIGESAKCDRKYDCKDGTDETKCDYFIESQRRHEQSSQSAPEQQQQHHREHSEHRVHHPAPVDLQNPTPPIPEHECTEYEVRCPNLPYTKCVHYDKLCDGVNDCGDNSDEQKCESGSLEENICVAGEYQCNNGQCVSGSVHCDHKYDCEDGSDETTCDYFIQAQKHRLSENAVGQEEQVHPAVSPQEAERERQLKERERLLAEREQEEARREAAERHREAEERRREEELRRREEEHRRAQLQTPTQHASPQDHNQIQPHVVQFKEEYDDENCLEHEFMCHTGECVDRRRVCDSREDCLDGSDEKNCIDHHNAINGHPNRPEPRHDLPPPVIEDDWPEELPEDEPEPVAPEPPSSHVRQSTSADDLQITVYPHEQTVREGRDAAFECRARTVDNGAYPAVRWTRVGGPLPTGAYESGGRLSFAAVAPGDSGRYVCIAQHNGHVAEAYATLTVNIHGPQEFQHQQSGSCTTDEYSCGTNECVKNDYVCDGEPDCRDRSDELNCGASKRTCEPNEFRCNNDRCIQKMWLCDGDDDCGDNSDEQNCGERKPGELCQPTEFRCRDGRQCVPQSFQCDGTNDCSDGSDEHGCVQPTVVEPPDSNKQVPQGDTFQLTCRAVAVPEAYINWRLNWGPVCEPPRCVQESEGGVGTLTVHNAQPLDQGAYTCEAINVKGRVLATPDCIVRIVSIPNPPPPTRPPAPPARVQMPCDPIGSTAPSVEAGSNCPCKPLVTGPSCNQCRPGSFHLNDKAPHGCLKCFCFGITDQCRSSDWHRTKEKLFFNGDSEGVTLSTLDGRPEDASFDYHIQGMLTHSSPHRQTLYWSMPQRFRGNKVTAYGGVMSFQLQYSGHGPVSNEPLVVLKGNGITLVHRHRDQFGHFQPDRPINIDVATYETNYERENGSPASREDLLMALADLDGFLIRATHVPSQVSTSLGDVSWEIAVDRDTQEGLALEVEQCSCPPGYIGLSCEDCAPGYERSGHGPYLGTCVPVRQTPPPQRACPPGAISPYAGYDGRCQCKPNLTGPNCDQCAASTFNPVPQSPSGCLKCFCSGVTNQCRSSSYRRASVEIDYRRGDQDQLEIGGADPRTPVHVQTRPDIFNRAINFAAFEEARGQTLYWKLPQKFLGDKVTSYGGKLRYTVRFSGVGPVNRDADVILKGNEITLQHRYRGQLQPDHDNVIEIAITEDQWERADGQPTTREHLLMALADLDAAQIKLSYSDECSSSSLIQVSLEHAEPYGQGHPALDVEQCDCPAGYVGTSCEDCAPGYRRTGGGLYLGLCERCECNGHASTCDEEYGHCLNCQHNTEGDQCERCSPGFEGDARRGTPHDCRPVAPKPQCQCNNHSPRGCDSYGRCLLCEHNTEGYHCEACKKGYYGDALKGTPYDCSPCPCPGASECYVGHDGQVKCRNCPAGYTGDRCDRCAPGYTKSTRSGGRECEPIGRHEPSRVEFVPEPQVPLRVNIHPPKHLAVQPGSRAKWTCMPNGGHRPEEVTIEWTKIGSNALPPHVRQQGNTLIIDPVEQGDLGQYRCTGTKAGQIATDEASLTIEAPPALNIMLTPEHQSVPEGDSATFTCLVSGVSNCEITFHKETIGGPLPYGVRRHGNRLHISNVRPEHAGTYYCSVTTNRGLSQSNPGRLDVQRKAWRPEADPPVQDIEVGDSARFRCFVRGVPHAEIQWRREDGQPMDSETIQSGGWLTIYSAKLHHGGRYVCSATDPQDTAVTPVDAPPVQLNVRDRAPAQRAPMTPQVDPLQQTVDHGQPARFRCWVEGEPNAQLRWSGRGNRPLPHGAREHNGELVFPSVSQGDVGEYVCAVYDPTSGRYVDSPPARLDVRQPSHPPQVDPAEQTVQEGSPSAIRCWVPGNPHARLSWARRGGDPLPPDAYDDGRGNLRVDRTHDIHEGDYECTAVDPQTNTPQVSQPARINVRIPENVVQPEQGSPPRPVATPPEITVKKGEPARFHCDAHSDTPADIHWTFGPDRGPLRGDVYQEGDDLVVDHADDTNTGEYHCTATNQFGSGHAAPVRLTVTDNEEPPTARVEPRVFNGKPGDRHQFKCHTTGLPPPQVTWSGPNGGPLPEGVTDLGGGVLDISNLQKDLEGDYTCTAENIVGSASDHGTVHLGPSLTVRTDPAGPRIVVVVGEPVEIKCEAFGDPDPDVEWLHDPGPERGDLPDDFEPVTISEQFIRHPHIGLMNAGKYTCKGSNSQATATKDIYIEVVEPSHVATVTVLGGTNQWFPLNQPAQLICASTGSSLVDRIEWVRLDGTLPHDVEDHNEQGLLHFGTFEHGYAGEYECRGYRKNELIGSAKVHIRPDDGSSNTVPRVEISSPRVRVVSEGDSIILDCNVQGYDGEVTYDWSLARGGNLVRELGKESQLVVKKADPTQDYGVYRCEVEDADSNSVGTAYTAVIVGFSSPEKAEEAKFEEATDAELVCPVYAVPGATVTWTRDGDELPSNAQPRGNKLLITDFDDTTAGLYTCTVQMDHNTIEGYVNARIFVPDTTIKVVLNVSNENVAVGDRIWLDCTVIGDPDAKIEYSRDGSEQLPAGAQVTGSRLLFNAVSEEDSGTYQCKAHTSEGTLVTSAVINVGSAKLGILGDVVSPPLPSVSTETQTNPENLKLLPPPAHLTPEPGPQVTIAPTASAEVPMLPHAAATHWPVEKETFVEEARRVPVIRTVGEEVRLVCAAQAATGEQETRWQRVGATPLPDGHRIDGSALVWANVRKGDEGLYQCLVELPGGQDSVSFVDLKVADFVPVFHGRTVMHLPPLTDEQWKDLDLELSVKPAAKDGIILHVSRGEEHGAEPENYHTVFLRRGKVVYRSQLGTERDELESVSPVRVGKWSKIRVIHNERERTLVVNTDAPVVRAVARPSEIVVSATPSSPVFLGGTPDEKQERFAGTISRIQVNHEPVPLLPQVLGTALGDSGVLARAQEPVEQSDECRRSPCQNGGVCVAANVHEGFRCECSQFFHGALCQFKGRFCANRGSCVAGVCIDAPQGASCVCPLDREGDRCESTVEPEEKFAGAYKFDGETSFLAIPPPRSVKNFSLSLQLNVHDASKDQIVAYIASSYDQKTAEFMVLAIKDGRFVNIYQNGGGKSTVESVANVEAGRDYKLQVSRQGHMAELKVNGVSTNSRVKTVAFPPGTSLFFGGFPPGMQPRKQAASFAPLQGCVRGIRLGTELVDVDATPGILSGNLSPCGSETLMGDPVALDADATAPPTHRVPVLVTPAPVTTSETAPVELASTDSGQHLTVVELGDERAGGGWSAEAEAETEEEEEVALEREETRERVAEGRVTPHSTIPPPATTTSTTETPQFVELESTSQETLSTPPALLVPETTVAPTGVSCEPRMCGDHGECEVVNMTHVVCQCKDYYDGPNCEHFKPIEHAARFEGNAYVVFSADDFPHLTSEREETIAFRLKTTAKYGVIFWQGQHPDSTLAGEDYISIGLNDGYLVYSYELGGGAAQIVSTIPVNDGKEHIVRAVRRGRNGTLTVDNEPTVPGTSSGILAMLNVEGNIYVGGVPDLELMTAGLYSRNLVGCVADIVLNNQKMDLMANSLDGVNVKPCDAWRSSRRRWMKSRKYRKLVIG